MKFLSFWIINKHLNAKISKYTLKLCIEIYTFAMYFWSDFISYNLFQTQARSLMTETVCDQTSMKRLEWAYIQILNLPGIKYN